MIPPYRKIAKGVINLSNKIPTDCIRMPIGTDGAVVEHLIQHSYKRKEIPYDDYLKCVVQASSKSRELFDSEKFRIVAFKSWYKKIPLYAVDMRTKTGFLGKFLKDEIAKIEEEDYYIDLKYAVVFDPNGKADVRGSKEELTDEERPKWVEKERVKKLILKKEGKLIDSWEYKITHDIISKFNHVPEIKREIDVIFEEEDVIKTPSLSL